MAKIRMCRKIIRGRWINRRVVAFLSAFLIMLGGGGLDLQISAAVSKDSAPFTYTGNWDIVEYTTGKYYARLLSSGVLTPKWGITVDAFLVGGGGKGGNATGSPVGGGGGGGGGYTTNIYSMYCDSPVTVTVGGSATATKFGVHTANAGSNGTSARKGGTGGSGGGGGGTSGSDGGSGGSNGSAGTDAAVGSKGSGQGSTTKPFGGSIAPFSSMSFSGGGGGGGACTGGKNGYGGSGGTGGGGTGGDGKSSGSTAGVSGGANTGGGGGGGGHFSSDSSSGGAGGSGIVIIRGDLEGVGAPISINTPENIQINNQYTVSWGESTTISATVSGYILEMQIDNGQWVQVYSGSARSCTQSLVRNQANTIRYRVKAYGVGSISGGALESGYTTGDIRSVINNSAPTVPPSITVPASYSRWSNTPLQISWGAAEDKDGDAITYIVECVKDNSNIFTVLGVQSGRTYAYANTFTDASLNIRFRVKARDSNNSDSGYVESPWVIIKQDTDKPTIQFF